MAPDRLGTIADEQLSLPVKNRFSFLRSAPPEGRRAKSWRSRAISGTSTSITLTSDAFELRWKISRSPVPLGSTNVYCLLHCVLPSHRCGMCIRAEPSAEEPYKESCLCC